MKKEIEVITKKCKRCGKEMRSKRTSFDYCSGCDDFMVQDYKNWNKPTKKKK